MSKKHFIILYIICFLILLTSCKNDDVVNVMKINDGEDAYCQITSFQENKDEVFNNVLEFNYDTATFFFNKLEFQGEEVDGFYTYTSEVLGNQIDLSYVTDDEEEPFKTTSMYNNLPKKTVYISTDLGYFIASVPSVYENKRVYDSISTIDDLEKPISITKGEGVFYITYTFPKNKNYTSEFFYLKSDVPLINFDKENKELVVRNELSGRFRLLSDGFYQKSYENYYPTGDGNYFRNCANYIAYHYMQYNKALGIENEVPFFNFISYSSTYVANQQISEYGFFETKSRSDWLFKDFLINKDFYDTRFNADNGELNILLFERFSDTFFLDTLNQYGEFFVQYAKDHSYKTNRGILVEDYYNPEGGIKTHSSLNHHVANLNFLLSLYDITKEQKYFDTAILMLYGIEDTKDDWILDNNDLAYALHYNGTNNIMKDYPYLTYNDLFIAKERLNRFGIQSDELEQLMESKMKYMLNNGITGYYQ